MKHQVESDAVLLLQQPAATVGRLSVCLIETLIASSMRQWSTEHISVVRSNMSTPRRATVCRVYVGGEPHACLVSAGWNSASDGINVGVTKGVWLWAIWRRLTSARVPQHVQTSVWACKLMLMRLLSGRFNWVPLCKLAILFFIHFIEKENAW